MSMSISRRVRSVAASVALSAAALGSVAASQAQASPVSMAACGDSALSHPFLPWADPSSYELAPGGDFESSLAGWSLSRTAAVVSGSEPAGVTGSVGSSSLALGSGASAQSPTTCVDAAYPTFRFFARTDTPGSMIAVSAVYPSVIGPLTVPVGVVALSPSWTPTAPMLTGSAIGGLLSNGIAPLSLRFTELSGTSQIDDVFVDPHTMH
ncbi:MAG: hypothetical protein QOH12_1414 [Solirubrobacteraceae bacterium]|jgi:hypothetical protein|nr:hypothetical protein [Solirubrobacteraceae bacterium]